MADQFDPRYRLAPRQTEDPGARRRARMLLEQQRDRLREIPRRPENIGRFEAWAEGRDLPDDRPRIGTLCTLIPFELVYALGGLPVRLGCGNAALVQRGEEVLTGDVCPLAKASFASFLDPQGPAGGCAAVVLPSSCDAKRKLGEILADFSPTFVFNLPPEQDAHRYGRFAADEVARLAQFLARVLGRRLTRRSLRRAVREGRRRTALVRALQDARARDPGALSVRDFFLILQALHQGADPQDWAREASRVLEWARAYRPERPRMRPRLVLTGAPLQWPNFKLLHLIEESGADVVADTLCTGAQSLYDPVVADEWSRGAQYRSLAQRYVFASACPCFISQATRLSRVLDLVDATRADGVVHHGLRLCQLFDIETYRLSQVLKERKIPFLHVRTDYSLEDVEQLRVRFEAFLEQVEGV